MREEGRKSTSRKRQRVRRRPDLYHHPSPLSMTTVCPDRNRKPYKAETFWKVLIRWEESEVEECVKSSSQSERVRNFRRNIIE